MPSSVEVPAELAGLLARGERVLWTGEPPKGLMLRPSDAFLIPFSLLWGGFAIFWETMAINSGAPFFFRLWGAPFVLVGLYLIFGRFLADARIRARTSYAVTSQRVLIASGLFQRDLKSLELRTLPQINFSMGRDNQGTLAFGSSQQPLMAFSGFQPWQGGGRAMPPQFESIPDAAKVMALIREAQTAQAEQRNPA
jgi:hypothetical protein